MLFRSWLIESLKISPYSRAKLAKELTLTKGSVDKWLAGQSVPKVASLYLLCQILHPKEAVDQYVHVSGLICADALMVKNVDQNIH
tara:strand:- start:22 stop:279 length:258 start_codon:yes stop_codon:yes gene_type:complete